MLGGDERVRVRARQQRRLGSWGTRVIPPSVVSQNVGKILRMGSFLPTSLPSVHGVTAILLIRAFPKTCPPAFDIHVRESESRDLRYRSEGYSLVVCL